MREKKKRRIVVIFIILALAAGGVAAVIGIRGGAGKASDDRTAFRKNTVALERMDLTRSVSATGTVQSSRSRTVSVDLNGITVNKVKAKVGDTVAKGDILVTFDESELRDALSDAKDSLSDAQSQADREVSSAREQLSEARTDYSDENKKQSEQISDAKKEKQDAKKQVSKLKKQVSSAKGEEEKAKAEEQLAKAEEALKQAESAYDNAVSGRESTAKQNKEKIQNAENAVETAVANRTKSIREAKRQVEEAEKSLEKCAVTAPIGGIVTAVGVEPGGTYSGGTMFQIDDTSSFTVLTSVDEYDISSVEVGQRVVILTEATEEDELEGKITSVAPSTESTTLTSGSSQGGDSQMSGTSGTSSDGYEVVIEVSGSDSRLRMGLTAKCSIILEEAADVYAVPYDAIQEKEDGTSVVCAVERGENGVSSREITVTKGMESDYYVEISGDGLSDGMKIEIPTDEVSDPSGEDSDDASSEGGFVMPGMGGPGASGQGGPGQRDPAARDLKKGSAM